MIPNNPFILLIFYLFLAGCAIWALRWALGKAGVPDPFTWLVPLVLGILLIILAFSMAGLPIFA